MREILLIYARNAASRRLKRIAPLARTLIGSQYARQICKACEVGRVEQCLNG